MVRLGPPTARSAHKGEGVDHRARADLEVEVVKGAQHALGVGDGRRGIARPWGALAGQRVRRRGPRPQWRTVGAAPVRAGGFRGRRQPAAEVPRLKTARLVPGDPDRREEAEPPHQVHPIRALRRRRPAASDELGEVSIGSRDGPTCRVEEMVGLEGISRRHERAHLGHRELGQVSRVIVLVEHGSAR